ncbi:MAG TPA: tRNA (guanosine(37)-N1)-methyltransferase TrmD [Acidimicrobiales bacterium]|nr:tRNA (guanosine(37)-N1)-methyltransferase TrmD [Acidimicrobiales bacterium]
MRVDVFTLFPDVVDAYLDASLIGKARAEGVLDLRVHDLRAQASGVHRSVDDAPYGGGAGMVLMPEPVFAAIEAVAPPRPLFALTPSGRVFDQALARTLATGDGFSLLCGRYEGFDARITDHLVDGELSIGDFVLAGGEPAAFVVIEAVARLVPGVLGNTASPDEESFGDDGLLEYPQYTRPPSFRGWDVPDVLRSGDHGAIAAWRKATALVRTLRRRPDLIERRGGLTDAERSLLDRWAPGEYD